MTNFSVGCGQHVPRTRVEGVGRVNVQVAVECLLQRAPVRARLAGTDLTSQGRLTRWNPLVRGRRIEKTSTREQQRQQEDTSQARGYLSTSNMLTPAPTGAASG